jgi:hypothetical protein
LKFDIFLRQLVAGQVQAGPDRTDYDLGPALVISYPEQLLDTRFPEVRQATSFAFSADIVLFT